MSTIKHSQISALLVDDDAAAQAMVGDAHQIRGHLDGNHAGGCCGTTLKDLGSHSTLPRTLRPGWKKPLRTNTT